MFSIRSCLGWAEHIDIANFGTQFKRRERKCVLDSDLDRLISVVLHRLAAPTDMRADHGVAQREDSLSVGDLSDDEVATIASQITSRLGSTSREDIPIEKIEI